MAPQTDSILLKVKEIKREKIELKTYKYLALWISPVKDVPKLWYQRVVE